MLSQTAEFLYKCRDYYSPEDERGVAWNNPDLRIPWNATDPFLSKKDRRHPALREIPRDQLPAEDSDEYNRIFG